jgi:hypothetical protein
MARPRSVSLWSATPQPDVAASDRQEGNAADAIRDAEVALAHQNSATAQLDLQVITAVLNAHHKTVAGSDGLDALQHDIETAVRTRSDLDTPAGARDFQRFLIDKLRDIRAVVASASLDDTSKSTLMAAWTSLYSSSMPEDRDADEGGSPAAGLAGLVADSADQNWPVAPDTGMDPYLDSPLDDDFDVGTEDLPPQILPAARSMTPPMPNIPSVGGGTMPGGGLMPGGAPGWAMPSGFPLSRSLPGADDARLARDVDDELPQSHGAEGEPSSDEEGDNHKERNNQTDHEAAESAAGDPAASGPTMVTLPNGETVTAASPQLAAAIKAAAAGMPIADAFRQQGITIPPPGTAVSDPVDPSHVVPGDIGMFTDRHALALGQSKALLDGQIQHISTVQGPSFLGWEHPPVPVVTTAPAKAEPPAPTRPATVGEP